MKVVPPLSHLDSSGRARMVDVSDKQASLRMARAEATVRLGCALATQLQRTGSVAKGNVIETARLAGIQGAKQTAQLIPLCHPLPLDGVDVDIVLEGELAVIRTVARTRAVTGVEMEAMTAATVAALTIYDMCKAASKAIVIEQVRLLEKDGGRSGHWRAAGAEDRQRAETEPTTEPATGPTTELRGGVDDSQTPPIDGRASIRAVVLTISDRCAAGVATDTTGPAVAELLRAALHAQVHAIEVLPDGKDGLAERLRGWADGRGIDLIIAAGGTGPSPRDQTPEAVREVVERLTPGFDEIMRQASLASTPLAMLSRACSGIRGATLILSLPGSERGATENLRAILPALPHCLAKLRGDPEDCGRPAP